MYNLILKSTKRGAKTPESSLYESMEKGDSNLRSSASSGKTARILLITVGTIVLAAAVVWSLQGLL